MESEHDENAVHRAKIIPPKVEAEIIRMHKDAYTYNDIARIKGYSYSAIKRCCERGRPRTEAEYKVVISLYRVDPSPVEIRAQCREFRINHGTWTSADESRYQKTVSQAVLK